MSEVFTITDISVGFDPKTDGFDGEASLVSMSIQASFVFGQRGSLTYSVHFNDTAVTDFYSYTYVAPEGTKSAFDHANHFPTDLLDKLQKDYYDTNFLLASLRSSELKDLVQGEVVPLVRALGLILRRNYPETLDLLPAQLAKVEVESLFCDLRTTVQNFKNWSPA